MVLSISALKVLTIGELWLMLALIIGPPVLYFAATVVVTARLIWWSVSGNTARLRKVHQFVLELERAADPDDEEDQPLGRDVNTPAGAASGAD